jgi:hypothetical protein
VTKNGVNNKEVTAHIYEYTTQISITPSMKIEGAEKGTVPVQIIFCLKEKNQKKINSHRWFFNAFGPILQPNVCVLLDVGTMPGPTSIYHLWKAFDINSNVGGACGEIVALKGKFLRNLINPLGACVRGTVRQTRGLKLRTVQSRRRISSIRCRTFWTSRSSRCSATSPCCRARSRHIVISPCRTTRRARGRCKSISWARKWFVCRFLDRDSDLTTPLHSTALAQISLRQTCTSPKIVFYAGSSSRSAVAHGSCTTSNLRTPSPMCQIRYGCSSSAAVASCSLKRDHQVPELISQRRRWLNGSFFAAIHSTVKFHYIYRSSHSFVRKFLIHIEALYQLFNLIFSWFALGNYYIAFVILSDALEDQEHGIKGIKTLNEILNYFYLGMLIMCFLLSLGNRPQGSKWSYTTAMLGFALITVYMTVSSRARHLREGVLIISYSPSSRHSSSRSKGSRMWSTRRVMVFTCRTCSRTASSGILLYRSRRHSGCTSPRP